MSSTPTDTSKATDTKKSKRWFPLESNPTLLTKYASRLGFDTAQYCFVDVYSTEDWALDMIPQPVAAVVMLYPLTDVQRAFEESEKLDDPPQLVSEKVWHMRQRIGNACGTIGVLHALANTPPTLRSQAIAKESWLGRYYESCPPSLSADSKADILEADQEIETLHDDATSDSSNATSRGSLEESVITHFIALVHVDGGLYELDGRKTGPVRHGDTTEGDLLRDACKVVEKFMKRDPGELRFTILALAPKRDD